MNTDSELLIEPRTLAKVAVPIPVQGPLSYSVADGTNELVRPGIRVRVPLGSRRLVGMVLETEQVGEAPDFALKPILEILDIEPVLDESLLQLADFVAGYYLTPIGEVVRSMVPAQLTGDAARRVSLTSAGAMAPLSGAVSARIREILLEDGRPTFAELAARLAPEMTVHAVLESVRDLQSREWVRVEAGSRGSSRYQRAIELMPGPRDELLERCGRSAKGKAVVSYLAKVDRPAGVAELTQELGCGTGVIRRLIDLAVVREFTQVQRQELNRHLLGEGDSRRHVLVGGQRTAVDRLHTSLASEEFGSFLLHGVTGSGKTEVFLRAIESALDRGRTAIVLVPEIALVPALARDLRSRFKGLVALLHSNLSRAERRQEWQRMRSGEARVVVGPRSAVFAPVPDLGLIVVDEEHDSAYKQEIAPRYNARDVALVRAQASGATALLCSATPSLESRLNVARSRYELLRLDERVGGGELPTGVLVDLRREDFRQRPGEVHFSRVLCDEVEDSLRRNEQIILLRNRRGYAPMLLCRACGEDHRCEDCGLPHTYHRRSQLLICHYCNSRKGIPPACGACGEQALEPIGAGTERVEERFKELFPGVAVDVLDRDVAQKVGGAAAVLENFRRGESRVLIGTQMVAKGHHFPRVSLAGVLSADSYLGFPDFRAVERTYCLLTQLAGRAGRSDVPGKVVVQTHYPNHYAIRAALEHDESQFVDEEMRFREMFHYPPFSRMVQILVKDKSQASGRQRIETVARQVRPIAELNGQRISGPAPAALERLRGEWRFQLLLRGPSAKGLRATLNDSKVLEDQSTLILDMDPQDLM